MNYNEFKDAIVHHLKTIYDPEEYDISVRKVTKNNGMNLYGLCIFKNGEYASPTVYLEGYYTKYLEGTYLIDIVRSIVLEYEAGKRLAPDFPLRDSNYEAVKNQIIMRLVNYEKNKEILADCPYIRFHDLAITFRWLAFHDDIGISTALITYKELELWGIPKSHLYADACKNTPLIFPHKISKLSSLLNENNMITEHSDVELLIITNEQGINGATCILYENVLEEIATLVGGNYYLLPSSIHEMMICPDDSRIYNEMLLSLVKDANHMVVSLGEVLSDNIYYYNHEDKVLTFIKESDCIS